MSTNRPTHEAYVVNGDGEKARWTKIGIGFFKNDGMTLLLDAAPMNARLIVRPVKTAMQPTEVRHDKPVR
jgi:hypothetical protein